MIPYTQSTCIRENPPTCHHPFYQTGWCSTPHRLLRPFACDLVGKMFVVKHSPVKESTEKKNTKSMFTNPFYAKDQWKSRLSLLPLPQHLFIISPLDRSIRSSYGLAMHPGGDGARSTATSGKFLLTKSHRNIKEMDGDD